MNSLVNSFCYLKIFWVLLSPKKNTELVHVSVWETGWDLLFTSVVNLLWLDLNFWVATLLCSQELVSGWTLSQWSWLCWEWDTITLLIPVLFGSLAWSQEKCFRLLKWIFLFWRRGLCNLVITIYTASSVDIVYDYYLQ